MGQALGAGRYLVKNDNTPQESALPRADRDAMDEFATYIRTLLGVLGHRVLDPVLSPRPRLPLADTGEAQTSAATDSHSESETTLALKSGSIVANAIRDTDALVVLADSLAAKQIAPSLSEGYRAVRQKLIDAEVLVDVGEHYRFQKNYPFPSPSQAAAVIVGYMINGRQVWRSAAAVSLKEVEEGEAKVLGERLLQEDWEEN